MIPSTTDEWLDLLTRRLDAAMPEIALHRSYANGQAPLPEMGRNLRASWEAFQRKARTDYGGLAIGSLADRIKANGVIVGSNELSAASLAAQRIWRDNRLPVAFADAIRDYLEVSVGYLIVGQSDNGRAVVTREAPEQFYAEPEPQRPWRVRAAVKVWRDIDEGMDFAQVWMPGESQQYVRRSMMDGLSTVRMSASGGWQPFGDAIPFLGAPPIVILDRAEPYLARHLDLIDRINLGKLQRLVTTAMQAFRQRAIKGDMPDVDADGNEIDWAKTFEPAPGALWDLPDGIDIWESQQTDIRPMLEGEKVDARDFAAVTRTPISVLIPDGANQSAEGAASAKEAQVLQAQAEIERLGPAIAMALVYALRVEAVNIGRDTVQVLWGNPAHVSLSEQYAAAAQARAAGLPMRSVLRSILGMSNQQIMQVEDDMAREIQASAGDVATGLRDRAEAMGMLIRSGVSPQAAAKAAELSALTFIDAVPVTLRTPEQ